MSFVMVDVESDGPIPGDYSMICFGAVLVTPALDKTFYGKLRPISDKWIPEALAVSGFTRDQVLKFEAPDKVMADFRDWLTETAGAAGARPMFISDNNGYDWQFINWYSHHFLGQNPFGFSSTNLGSLYKGLVRDTFKSFKHLRVTRHSHHPVDDAKGNAEAMLTMIKEFDLKINL